MQCFAKYDGQLATAATVWHELVYGVAALPDSKRKAQLQNYLSALLKGRLLILPYEQAAAEWLVGQKADLKSSGKVVGYQDGEIAAVAAVNQLTLVTRNIVDFQYFKSLRVENWFD